jgi:hypothetical protein
VDKLRKRLLVEAVLVILLKLAGYVLLIWADWRIALAVFLIYSGANLARRVEPRLETLSLAEKLVSSGGGSDG